MIPIKTLKKKGRRGELNKITVIDDDKYINMKYKEILMIIYMNKEVDFYWHITGAKGIIFCL